VLATPVRGLEHGHRFLDDELADRRRGPSSDRPHGAVEVALEHRGRLPLAPFAQQHQGLERRPSPLHRHPPVERRQVTGAVEEAERHPERQEAQDRQREAELADRRAPGLDHPPYPTQRRTPERVRRARCGSG
jgi:hypothetical protein